MNNTNIHIREFDAYYTNSRIQMLKIIHSILPPDSKKAMALYIKFLELERVLHSPGVSQGTEQITKLRNLFSITEESAPEILSFLDELIPYSTENEKDKINILKTIVSQISHLKEMQETMEMM